MLATPITDADGVSDWTDGIFNASVPLPADRHTGVLPKGAGYHHYPRPIVDIELFKYDDFNLFVTDSSGSQLAVTPAGRRGSGDGRVAVAWTPEGHPARGEHPSTLTSQQRLILPADSDVAKRAFANQS